MDPDMRRGVDEQKPGSKSCQAPREAAWDEKTSRTQPVNQEDRKGSSGSLTDEPRGRNSNP